MWEATVKTRKQGEVITTDNGVIIVGTSNLPGTLSNNSKHALFKQLDDIHDITGQRWRSHDFDDDDILVGAPEGRLLCQRHGWRSHLQ